jgi:hypothetical protein
LLAPTALYWDQCDYDVAKQIILRDLATGPPLKPKEALSFMQSCDHPYTGEEIAQTVWWSPSNGFFVDSSSYEIKIIVRPTPAANEYPSLVEWMQARYLVANMPGSSASQVIFASEAGVSDQFEVRRLTVTLLCSKRCQLTVTASDNIGHVKQKLQESLGVRVHQQDLFYAGVSLENHRTLSEYQIPDGAVLNLVLRLRGGPAASSIASASGDPVASSQVDLAFGCAPPSRILG